jgi:hypothetical protein
MVAAVTNTAALSAKANSHARDRPRVKESRLSAKDRRLSARARASVRARLPVTDNVVEAAVPVVKVAAVVDAVVDVELMETALVTALLKLLPPLLLLLPRKRCNPRMPPGGLF